VTHANGWKNTHTVASAYTPSRRLAHRRLFFDLARSNLGSSGIEFAFFDDCRLEFGLDQDAARWKHEVLCKPFRRHSQTRVAMKIRRERIARVRPT
jgi:hypothetical protein